MKKRNFIALLTSIVMLITVLAPASVFATEPEPVADPPAQEEQAPATDEVAGDNGENKADDPQPAPVESQEEPSSDPTAPEEPEAPAEPEEVPSAPQEEPAKEESAKTDSASDDTTNADAVNAVDNESKESNEQAPAPQEEPSDPVEPAKPAPSGDVSNAFPDSKVKKTSSPEEKSTVKPGGKFELSAQFESGQAFDNLFFRMATKAVNITSITAEAFSNAEGATYSLYKEYKVKGKDDLIKLPVIAGVNASEKHTFDNLTVDASLIGEDVDMDKLVPTGIYYLTFDSAVARSVSGTLTVKGKVDDDVNDSAVLKISPYYTDKDKDGHKDWRVELKIAEPEEKKEVPVEEPEAPKEDEQKAPEETVADSKGEQEPTVNEPAVIQEDPESSVPVVEEPADETGEVTEPAEPVVMTKSRGGLMSTRAVTAADFTAAAYYSYSSAYGLMSNVPLSGVKFTIINSTGGSQSVTTGEDGRATFNNLQFGDYTIAVESYDTTLYVCNTDAVSTLTWDSAAAGSIMQVTGETVEGNKLFSFRHKARPRTINVTVVDADTNAPISGIPTTLRGTSASGTTNSSGYVSLTATSSGVLYVNFDLTGTVYDTDKNNNTLVGRGFDALSPDVVNTTITLKKAEDIPDFTVGAYYTYGSAYGLLNDYPISGVLFELVNRQGVSKTATTGEDGIASFSDVAYGEYTLTVKRFDTDVYELASGFESSVTVDWNESVSSTYEGNASRDMMAHKLIGFKFKAKERTLKVTLLDSQTDAPIEGIPVSIGNLASSTTDSNGFATLTAVTSGRFDLTINLTGTDYDNEQNNTGMWPECVFDDMTPSVVEATYKLVKTPSTEPEPEVDTFSATICIDVVDTAGDHISGVGLAIGKKNDDGEYVELGYTITNDHGEASYLIENATEGEYLVMVKSDGWEGVENYSTAGAYETITVDEDNPGSDVTITLKTKEELVNSASLVITAVENTEEQTPIAGAVYTVTLDGSEFSADVTTGEDGSTDPLEGLTPGTYIITEKSIPEEYVKLGETIEPVQIVSNTQMSAKLKYNKANSDPEQGSIIVKAMCSDDNSGIAGITYNLKQNTDDGIIVVDTKTTGEDGTATFAGLAYGDYVLEDAIDGFPAEYVGPHGTVNTSLTAATMTVEIPYDKNQQAETGKIIIFAVCDDDSYIPGIKYLIAPIGEEDGQLTASTDENGKTESGQLVYGTYKVKENEESFPEDYEIVDEQPTEVALAEETVTIYRHYRLKNPAGEEKGKIEVIVKDSENFDEEKNDYQRVVGATVSIRSGEEIIASYATNDDGVAVFDDIPYGDYNVAVTAVPAGYETDETSEQDITLAGQVFTVELSVTPIPVVDEGVEVTSFTGLAFDPDTVASVIANPFEMKLDGYSLELNKEDAHAAQILFHFQGFTPDMEIRATFAGQATGYYLEAVDIEPNTISAKYIEVAREGDSSAESPLMDISFNSEESEMVIPENTKFLKLWIYNPTADFAVTDFAIFGTTPDTFHDPDDQVLTGKTIAAFTVRTDVYLTGATIDERESNNGSLVVADPEAALAFTPSVPENEAVLVDDNVSYDLNFTNTTATQYMYARIDITTDSAFVPALLNIGKIENYEGRIVIQTVGEDDAVTLITQVSPETTVDLSESPSSHYRVLFLDPITGVESISGMQLKGRYNAEGSHEAVAEFMGVLTEYPDDETMIDKGWTVVTPAKVEVIKEKEKEPEDNPEDPGENPEDPGENPEDPGENPEDPGNNPEDPGEKPDDPGTNPGDGGGSYKPPIGDNTGNDTPEDEPVALAVDTPNIYANTNTIAYGDDAVFNIRNLNAVGLETDNYYVLHIMIPEGVQVRSISFPGFGSSVKVSLAYQSGSTELGNYVSNDSVALTERQGSNLRYIAFQMRGVTEVKPDGEITIMLKNISARDRVATLQAILSARDAKTKVLEQHYDKYNIALAGPKTNTTSGTTGGTGSATGSGTTDTTGTATDGYTPATTVRANNLSRPFILLTSPDGLVTDILIEPVFDYVSTEMNMYNTYPLMLPLDENAPAPAAVDTGAENSIGASPVTNDTIRAFVHMMNLRHMMREEFALQKSQSLMTRILRANRQK